MQLEDEPERDDLAARTEGSFPDERGHLIFHDQLGRDMGIRNK